jgi:hypothetical protein
MKVILIQFKQMKFRCLLRAVNLSIILILVVSSINTLFGQCIYSIYDETEGGYYYNSCSHRVVSLKYKYGTDFVNGL